MSLRHDVSVASVSPDGVSVASIFTASVRGRVSASARNTEGLSQKREWTCTTDCTVPYLRTPDALFRRLFQNYTSFREHGQPCFL